MDLPVVGDRIDLQEFRIAFRAEGEFVNAYLAKPNTMAGSVHLASFSKQVLDVQRETWHEYMELVQRAIQRLGAKVDFTTQPAPEHERAGHG